MDLLLQTKYQMRLQRGLLITLLGLAGLISYGQDRDRIEPRSSTASATAGWEVLDKGLSDSSERHRQQVVLAAGSIGATADAVKFVGGAMRDKSTLVRQTAAAVLGQFGTPDTVPYLRRALTDNVEVGFTAARALCEMGDPDGRAFLQDVLTGERKDKPSILAKNVKYAKKKLTPAELAMMGTREAAGILLGPASLGIVVGEEAVKAQTSGKGSGESGRTISAATLADHPDDYTRPLLEWALDDPHPEVRAAAAKGLGKCGNQESVPKLRRAMTDQRAAVRYMAAASLIRLGGEGGPVKAGGQ